MVEGAEAALTPGLVQDLNKQKRPCMGLFCFVSKEVERVCSCVPPIRTFEASIERLNMYTGVRYPVSE